MDEDDGDMKSGRPVDYAPVNGTQSRQKGCSIDIKTRISPDLDKKVNTGFRGKWLNAENKGKSEAEIMALWNEKHPEDPID
jgi:hypothetical protein